MGEYITLTPIEVKEGIKKTVEWYKGHKKHADSKK
jgi:hypothetical protein